jgi:hypothetical protein
MSRGRPPTVQRLLLEQGAVNVEGRVAEGWAGVLGFSSVGADLAGRLANALLLLGC